MDPRPVDFSYIRPRHNNLTYQSYGLSQSLFHVGAYSKKFNMPSRSVQKISMEKTLKANPQQLIHTKNSKWNSNQLQLSRSYIYQNPSTFTNVHTRKKNENLSQSALLENKSATLTPNKHNQLEGLARQQIKNEADSLSNWTYSLMKPNKQQGQDRVYQYQQKAYNIINLKPKNEPDAHRQYPRYSLENKLIQKQNNMESSVYKR